jgi:hypothetical protein
LSSGPAGWDHQWDADPGCRPSRATVVPLEVADRTLGQNMLGARESNGDGAQARAAAEGASKAQRISDYNFGGGYPQERRLGGRERRLGRRGASNGPPGWWRGG